MPPSGGIHYGELVKLQASLRTALSKTNMSAARRQRSQDLLNHIVFLMWRTSTKSKTRKWWAVPGRKHLSQKLGINTRSITTYLGIIQKHRWIKQTLRRPKSDGRQQTPVYTPGPALLMYIRQAQNQQHQARAGTTPT